MLANLRAAIARLWRMPPELRDKCLEALGGSTQRRRPKRVCVLYQRRSHDRKIVPIGTAGDARPSGA